MKADVLEQFLCDQIPLRIQSLLPQKLKLAYEAADAHINATPMLQIPSAAGSRGRIVSHAVDFSVKGLIDSGEWHADYSWPKFARPTGNYLQIRLSHSTLSISQVQNPRDQPRNVIFRENSRIGNSQLSFGIPGLEGELEEDTVTGNPSFLLVHGHQNLEFAHIGIPHHHHERGYLYKTKNLMQMMHEVQPSDLPPPEPIRNVEELMSLKAEIEKWQRDNEGK